MLNKYAMTTLLIATRNQHKVAEIRTILGDQFAFLTLADLPQAPETVEDAGTFEGNATKKAVELAKWASGADFAASQPPGGEMVALADDSGLEVDALDGAPGVHSARFAALDTGAPGNSPTAENNAKLLRLLRGVPQEKRTGRFRCVLALVPVLGARQTSASPVCDLDEFEFETELFDGACEGHIGFEPRGQGGFGYDPLFVPHGCSQTFAELGETIKNRLSHRAKALEKLARRLRPPLPHPPGIA
jgi:XTP/dITP diphosphohydrolase